LETITKIGSNEKFDFGKRYEETKWFENHVLKYNFDDDQSYLLSQEEIG
jgi:hypothetical protein